MSEAADAVEDASDTKALDVVARSGFAVMALLHIIVGAIAIALAFGQPGQAEATGARDISTAVLNTPLGLPVLVAVGLTTMGVGAYFVIKGLRRGFKKELTRFEGTRRGKLIDSLGVVGHVAKGIALTPRCNPQGKGKPCQP